MKLLPKNRFLREFVIFLYFIFVGIFLFAFSMVTRFYILAPIAAQLLPLLYIIYWIVKIIIGIVGFFVHRTDKRKPAEAAVGNEAGMEIGAAAGESAGKKIGRDTNILEGINGLLNVLLFLVVPVLIILVEGEKLFFPEIKVDVALIWVLLYLAIACFRLKKEIGVEIKK